MKLSLIVAMGWETAAIGYKGGLPWPRIKQDVQHFMDVTKRAGTVIMGRKTWESIGSKPLPGRRCVVMSHRIGDMAQTVPSTVDLARGVVGAQFMAEKTGCEEAVVIGGAQIYKLFLDADLIDTLYLTKIDIPHTMPADTFFPGGVPQSGDAWQIQRQENVPQSEWPVGICGLRFLTMLRNRERVPTRTIAAAAEA